MRSFPQEGLELVYGSSNLLEAPDDGVDEFLRFVIIVQVAPVEVGDGGS